MTGTDTHQPPWDAKQWCMKTATQEGRGPLEAQINDTWDLCGVEDEVFTLELACGMIGDTPQKDDIQVVHQESDLE